MKKCTICKQEKQLSEFNKHAKRSDGLQPHCRDCNKERSRAYYARNSSAHRENVAIRNKEYKKEVNDYVLDYLRSHPCVDCGESDILVLEFDHLDPTLKDIDVSKARSNRWSIKRLQTEIEKCEVVCANDHKRRTAKQFGSYRLPGSLA